MEKFLFESADARLSLSYTNIELLATSIIIAKKDKRDTTQTGDRRYPMVTLPGIPHLFYLDSVSV
jgi:hypothetical protein